MADKPWTKLTDYNNTEVYEVSLDVTDSESEFQGLDVMKTVSIMVTTTGG